MPFLIEPSLEISCRYDFALLANARGYKDAVEVGVDQGVFARDFLSRFKGNWLILVDPYEPYAEMPFDRSGDLIVAALALAPFHGRHRFVRRRSSSEVAAWVKTFCTPEFVYIDASHEESDVRSDIETWWDALPADRGLLAGHDWDDWPGHAGVKRAVEGFARDRGLVVRLTHETESPASWYIYRSGEPDKLMVRLFREGEAPNPHFDRPR